MQFDAHCIECLVGREFRLAAERRDGEASFHFMKDVLRTVLDAPAGVGAPYLVPGFTAAYHRYFGPGDPYAQLRRDSNDYVLRLLPELREPLPGRGLRSLPGSWAHFPDNPPALP